MELNQLRDEIDKIDQKLVDLFCERMQLAAKVACQKKKDGLEILNQKREREVLARVGERSGEFEMYTRILYNTIFGISRSYQSKLFDPCGELYEKIEKSMNQTAEIFPAGAVVACQGVEGAYSQIACDKLFPMGDIIYFSNFDMVARAVEKGLCEYGILPVENSSNGCVGEVYNLMRDKNFYIARSIRLQINHVLLAKQGTRLDEIKEIVSHEQAIGQCTAFLASRKDVKITTFANTAMAAEYVSNSNSNGIAAICSPACAALYGLQILSDNIQNSDNNYTRFLCISKALEIYPGSNKISLMLTLAHKPGSLYELIGKFAALGLNLNKLESRPIPGRDFEFMFYFDFEGSVKDNAVRSLLCELEQNSENYIFLGNYSEV